MNTNIHEISDGVYRMSSISQGYVWGLNKEEHSDIMLEVDVTPMMPDMGIHYMNPGIGGFTITKPQILVYEHHGNTWQLGALEWVFPSMPKTPPLQDATFGFFPAACHYRDGTFIPDENSKTCQKTNPKTGSTFSFWHPDLTTMHVWIWYPNPAGLYSSTNPLVAPFNGG